MSLIPMFAPNAGSVAFPAVAGTPASGSQTGGTSYAIPLPSSPNAGEVLLVCVMLTNGANARLITGVTAGWNELFRANSSHSSGGIRDWAVYYKVSDGTETTVTVSASGTANFHYVAYRISGAGTPQASTAVDSAGATSDPANFTPVGGSKKYLWIGFCNIYVSETFTTAPTGFSPITRIEVATGATAGAPYQFEAASLDPDAWTVSTSISRNITIAIPPP